MDEGLHVLITPEQIGEFETSQAARDVFVCWASYQELIAWRYCKPITL